MAARFVIEFVLCAFALWRITRLFADESGPFDCFKRLRQYLEFRTPFLFKLIDCFYCLSIWFAIPFAIYLSHGWIDGLLIWLALSGNACIIYTATEN